MPAASVVVVAMVRLLVAFAVALRTLNVAVAPDGRPVVPNVTVELKPPTMVSVAT